MKIFLVTIATLIALLAGFVIVKGIEYHPDPAGWDCSGGDPLVGVCAPADNRARQFALLGINVLVYGAAVIFIVRRVN